MPMTLRMNETHWVDDLGKRIDIDVIVKEDGSYLITTCGLPLVEDGISYDLSLDQGRVYWTRKIRQHL